MGKESITSSVESDNCFINKVDKNNDDIIIIIVFKSGNSKTISGRLSKPLVVESATFEQLCLQYTVHGAWMVS